jgi:acyl carrier protein|tara:strand:- start:2733 stop:2963 length:231 start_codon:yes stop_codon:yes gene_type:complete
MNKASIIEIFNDILDLDEGCVTQDSTPEDIDNWDSMSNVNIIVALEEEFRIKFKLEDIQDARTVNDFINLVNKYTK